MKIIQSYWGFSPKTNNSMSFVKIMVHCVWGTKNRQPLLIKERKKLVIDHIKENASKKSIYIDTINGHYDHLHALISLDKEQVISKVLHLLKGESAFWINNRNKFGWKLEWADEYFAVSIGGSQLQTVRNYINNQEIHHQKVSFQEEYEAFILKYGFKYLG